MFAATVTLSDGRPAVVHSEHLAVGHPVDDEERAALADTARRNFGVALAAIACRTARAAAPVLVTETRADGWTWAYANVLCAEPRCRITAEVREAEQDAPHPAAARLREWAAQQTPAVSPGVARQLAHWPAMRSHLGCGCTDADPGACQSSCYPAPGSQCRCHHIHTADEYAELYRPALHRVYRRCTDGTVWRVGELRDERAYLVPEGRTDRSRWVRLSVLHGSSTTRTGAPRRTGYALALDSVAAVPA